MRLADRLDFLGTETAFIVFSKALELEKQGKDIVHLEIGEPDFDTPDNIIESAVKALRNHWTHYCPSAGLAELRETVADDFSKRRGVKVEPHNVVITPGGKPIIMYTMLSLVNPGEEVIYPNPGYPIYESVINFIGAKSVPIKMREERNFRLDVDELISLITPKTKMIVINSPHNPTGSVLTEDDLKAIAEIAVEKDIYILADEIYNRIIYSGKHFSITKFPGMLERTIILDGLSKTYAMTGWRIGYGIMPEKLAVQVAKLETNTNSCTSTFTQVASIEAIKGDQSAVDKMVNEFKERRDIFIDGLDQIAGFDCHKPEGAFYLFPNINSYGISSSDMEHKLMHDGGIAALSGTSFGAFGEGYIRFSYATSTANIEKALNKLTDFVGRV
jgi:aspartate/methionine/tyrosine aminotransferase